jgi:hypothetical protein
MKNAVFWNVAPCRSCVNRCFGGTYRLNFQAGKSVQFAAICLTLVPRSRIILPSRRRRYISPKRRYTLDLHGTTSQKTTVCFLIHRTSNMYCKNNNRSTNSVQRKYRNLCFSREHRFSARVLCKFLLHRDLDVLFISEAFFLCFVRFVLKFFDRNER